jgi:hypothetical protein
MIHPSPNPNERRTTPRFDEAFDITYSLLADRDATPVLFYDSETIDISRTGVRALFEEPAPEGMLVQLCFRIPLLKSPILMIGKVRWCGPAGEGKFQAGIQFTGMFPSGLEQMIEQVRRHRAATGPGPF